MSLKPRVLAPWSAAAMVVALLVDMGTLYALPRLITARAMAGMGEPNVMHFPARADATARTLVRPNPDVLYSTCPFDLAAGALRITAHVPHTTYWSVSGYDAASNNFIVRDALGISADSIEIVVIRRGMKLPPLGEAAERIIVIAPTGRGVFLFRMVIDRDSDLAALDAMRRQASCGTVPGSGGAG